MARGSRGHADLHPGESGRPRLARDVAEHPLEGVLGTDQLACLGLYGADGSVRFSLKKRRE